MQLRKFLPGAPFIAGAMAVLVPTAFLGAQTPELRFRWHYGYSYDDMVEASDIVVVGRVTSVSFDGPVVEATDDRGYGGAWRLVRTEAVSETLLKGDAPTSLEFFFYTSTGPVMGDWNNLDVGDRCIFFLVRDGGTLRSVRDFWRSSIEIGTGRPGPNLPGSDNSLKERIATMLLTPREGLEPKRLVRLLSHDVPIADEWLGQCRTTALLRSLLGYRDEDVRNAAESELRGRLLANCAEK